MARPELQAKGVVAHTRPSLEAQSMPPFTEARSTRTLPNWHIEPAVGDHGMVPGLSLKGLKSAQLVVRVGVRCHEGRRALFGNHKQ